MDESTNGRSSSRSTFLRNTGLVILLLTIAAFALKAIVHPERLARYTPLVILHGVVMIGWLAFFARQASLISKGRTRRHIAGGKLSWILVLLVIGVSWPVGYSLMVEFQSTEVFVANSFLLIAFLCFFSAAILAIRRKDSDSHKRYMFFACLTILLPAIGRFADVLTGNEAFAMIIFPLVVVLLPLLFDRSIGRGFHRSTIIGISASLAWFVLMLVAIALPTERLLLGSAS